MDPKTETRLLVLLALALGGGLFAGVFEESNPSSPASHVLRTSAVPTEEEQPPRPRLVGDPIGGQPVSQALADRLPIGVMIDNHPDARAQWGLSFAARVYEALTEGGITRYLAIFGPEDVDRVGPVRSARTQFLGYALELHAALAHVGGNEDALALIAARHLRNLDEFRYAGAYRRIFKPRIAYEHTMFTSTRALRTVADQNGRRGDVSVGHPIWKADPPPDQRPMNQRVTIDFSTPAYKVSWVYRRATNDYQRILAGTVDTDAATSKAISARSIAIAVIKRTHGRTRIGEDTWAFADIGSGEAWVVQDGTVTQGTWQKIPPQTVCGFSTRPDKRSLSTAGRSGWRSSRPRSPRTCKRIFWSPRRRLVQRRQVRDREAPRQRRRALLHNQSQGQPRPHSLSRHQSLQLRPLPRRRVSRMFHLSHRDSACRAFCRQQLILKAVPQLCLKLRGPRDYFNTGPFSLSQERLSGPPWSWEWD